MGEKGAVNWTDIHLAQIEFIYAPPPSENLTSKGKLQWGYLQPYPGMYHLKDPKRHCRSQKFVLVKQDYSHSSMTSTLVLSHGLIVIGDSKHAPLYEKYVSPFLSLSFFLVFSSHLLFYVLVNHVFEV